MMKRILPFGLVLPVVACAASSSEPSESSASSLTIGGEPCLCVEPDPSPTNSPGGSHEHCDPTCLGANVITVAPGQEDVDVAVEAGINWPDPAHVTISISGLPTGVTATWFQTSPYILPAQGIAGAFALTASPSAPSGSARATVTAQSGTAVSYAYLDVTVGGTCVPTNTCSGRCGSVDDGCSHQLSCGGCSSGQFCNASGICETQGGGCNGVKAPPATSCKGKWVCCGSDGWECGVCQ